MTRRVKLFFSKSKNLSAMVFVFLIVGSLMFVGGPSIYAEFLRLTGDEGWGLGEGYGYGYGYGWDRGQVAGYRTGGGELSQYGYGMGYGYRSTETSTEYGGETYYDIEPGDMADGAALAVFELDNPEAPTSATTKTNINITVGDVQVLIPEGTALTNGAGGGLDIELLESDSLASQFAAIEDALSSGRTVAEVFGAMSFGIPGMTLYFSQPITVVIPVTGVANGTVVSIKRSPDGGTTWETTGFTANSSDTCASGVGSNPVNEATVTGGLVTIHTCRASDFVAFTTTTTSSGGGGGGGGASSCSSVVYGDWKTACVGDKQYRDVASTIPSFCNLTVDQQLARERACVAEQAQGQTGTTDTTSTTGTGTGSQTGSAYMTEAQIVNTGDAALLVGHMHQNRYQYKEQNAYNNYVKALISGVTGLSATNVYSLTNFITYGTQSTVKLGEGERAGVVNSFKAAFGRLPMNETDWEDVIKIGNGRWPGQVNEIALNKAKAAFKKIYLRDANMSNKNDNAAVTIMAYGLRSANRNLASEKAAINIFKNIFKKSPLSAIDWDQVRAIAYSGATR